jgi:predicted transcriptional regulator
VVKRSVSLDPDVASRVQSAAEEDAVSFSTWLNDAADQALRLREGLKGVATWEADTPGGPLTAQEIAEGERAVAALLGQLPGGS